MKMPSLKVLNKYMGMPLLYPKRVHFKDQNPPEVLEDHEQYDL